MKPYLPNQSDLFEKALIRTIETIRSCQTGISFLAHFVGLIQVLRDHPITADWIKGLEVENQRRREVFNIGAIEALEAEWLFLWSRYPSWECRKALIRIIHFFTRGKIQSTQMPFEHTCFLFLEFKTKYNCHECSITFSAFIKQNQQLHASCDPKIYTEYIQTSLELDPVYFWDRLCLLQRIYEFTPDKHQSKQTPIKGKWKEIKYVCWEKASKSSLQMILRLAQRDLWVRFDSDGFKNEMQESLWPIDVSCKFFRTSCEAYLDRLFINLNPIFLDIEQQKQDATTPSQGIGSKTKPQQKTDELVKHTKNYWEQNPKASYNQVYKYYCDRCRFPQPYSRSEWERKVRDLKLDPRPPREKVRGLSEKGR